jgi:hypothetical protein
VCGLRRRYQRTYYTDERANVSGDACSVGFIGEEKESEELPTRKTNPVAAKTR